MSMSTLTTLAVGTNRRLVERPRDVPRRASGQGSRMRPIRTAESSTAFTGVTATSPAGTNAACVVTPSSDFLSRPTRRDPRLGRHRARRELRTERRTGCTRPRACPSGTQRPGARAHASRRTRLPPSRWSWVSVPPAPTRKFPPGGTRSRADRSPRRPCGTARPRALERGSVSPCAAPSSQGRARRS